MDRTNTTANDDAKSAPSKPTRGLGLPWRDLVALLRIHQWSKNILVFTSLVLAHEFTLDAVRVVLMAFASFSLAASAAYVLNDIRDVDADRKHPRKCQRPIASGAVDPRAAVVLVPVLLAASLVFAAFLPVGFGLTLVAYFTATCLYTWRIKRMLAADVVVLGCLYCLRVIAGDRAMGSDPSEWLIGFSLFFFLALALVKRFTELSNLAREGGQRLPSRSYRVEDLPVLLGLAAASGFSALVIFVRYLDSQDVELHYSHPERLWYIVPILVYWLVRLLLLTNRLDVQDDPVVFVLRDSKSLLCAAAVGSLLLCAI